MNKTIKWFLIPLFVILVIYFGYNIYKFCHCDSVFFGDKLTKTDLINNWKTNKNEIIKLQNYFDSIVPKDNLVILSYGKCEIETFKINNVHNKLDNWELVNGNKKIDSFNKLLNWNNETLKEIKSKLLKANCFSIENGNPTVIGFKQSGMTAYYYKIFDKKLNDSLILRYNDGCINSFLEDNVVLGFRSGALGPECFEDFKSE